MAIRLSCPCGKRFTAKEDSAGEYVRCPACGKKVVVPEPEGGTYGTEEEGSVSGARDPLNPAGGLSFEAPSYLLYKRWFRPEIEVYDPDGEVVLRVAKQRKGFFS